MTRIVLAHGGAASKSAHRDGPERAARAGLEAMRAGGTPLDAVVEATVVLEDDPRFNAGTGSNLRFDGKTIEMDASCMASDGRFGAVAAIRAVRNPVRVARSVLDTPHNLLAGEGATRYARALGHPPHDPWTENAQRKFDELWKAVRAQGKGAEGVEWDLDELERHWNYERPLKAIVGSSDTVGAVATDGESYAAALSTGGTTSVLLGRVGDSPLPGCGLHAGPAGAVAATGDGDHLTRAFLAYRVYRMLEDGVNPADAVDEAVSLFPERVDVGLIVVRGAERAGGSNRDMAWASVVEES